MGAAMQMELLEDVLRSCMRRIVSSVRNFWYQAFWCARVGEVCLFRVGTRVARRNAKGLGRLVGEIREPAVLRWGGSGSASQLGT